MVVISGGITDQPRKKREIIEITLTTFSPTPLELDFNIKGSLRPTIRASFIDGKRRRL